MGAINRVPIKAGMDKGFTKYKISRYASEFVGTFILVASVKMIIGTKSENAAIGVGTTLMMIVYHYGYNSLAMFNPSVTIGQVIRNPDNFERSNPVQIAMYFAMQFLGGLLGGFFGALAGGKNACNVYTHVMPRYQVHEAFFSELFFCTILVSVNLHVATDKKLAGNQMYGLAIGAVLMISAMAIGPISGSAINPAVWLGTVASAAACLEDGQELIGMKHAWIYWIAHILAGIIAGFWFKFIYGGEGKLYKNVHRIDVATNA